MSCCVYDKALHTVADINMAIFNRLWKVGQGHQFTMVLPRQGHDICLNEYFTPKSLAVSEIEFNTVGGFTSGYV